MCKRTAVRKRQTGRRRVRDFGSFPGAREREKKIQIKNQFPIGHSKHMESDGEGYKDSPPAETRRQSGSMVLTGVSRGSGLDTQLRQFCKRERQKPAIRKGMTPRRHDSSERCLELLLGSGRASFADPEGAERSHR